MFEFVNRNFMFEFVNRNFMFEFVNRNFIRACAVDCFSKPHGECKFLYFCLCFLVHFGD
jgi:hypothetical protein